MHAKHYQSSEKNIQRITKHIPKSINMNIWKLQNFKNLQAIHELHILKNPEKKFHF